MTKFFYIARDDRGNKITGAEEAPTQEKALEQLHLKNLVIVNLIPEDKDLEAFRLREDIVARSRLKRKHYGIRSEDLVLFCRQLSMLLNAGVTIFKSLEIISLQVSSYRLFAVIKDLQKNMEAGLSFHEAVAKHPKVFSELWINLIESGEASGNMSVILNRLSGYLERAAAFKRKIISAMIYPVILLVAGLGALLFLTLKIIPIFADLFQGLNIKLPLLTKGLILASTIIRRFFFPGLVLAAILFYFLKKYLSTKEGRKRLERFLFSLPLLGELFRSLVIEMFTSEMATLVESGVPILYSLEITEHSVGNLVMSEIIRKIKEEVRQGKSLGVTFEKSGFFEPMVVQMITIGEEIGDLPNMFKRLNAFFQEYTETFLTRFTTMFEPFLLVFMGIIIATIVIGMYLPIFEITQIAK